MSKKFKLMCEGWNKYLKETAMEGEPSFQGVHPLIDGLYKGNGISASTLNKVPAAIEIMKQNPENEHFKLALEIYSGSFMVGEFALHYLPFGFEDALVAELASAGLPQADVQYLQYEFSDDDNEYRVPYSEGRRPR